MTFNYNIATAVRPTALLASNNASATPYDGQSDQKRQDQGDVAGRFNNNRGFNNRPGSIRRPLPKTPDRLPSTPSFKSRGTPNRDGIIFKRVNQPYPTRSAVPAAGDSFYQRTIGSSFAQTGFTIPTLVNGQQVDIKYSIQSRDSRSAVDSAAFAKKVWDQNQADWNPPGKPAKFFQARDSNGAAPKDRISLLKTVQNMQTITVTGTVDGKPFTATMAYKIDIDPVTKERFFYVGLQTGRDAPSEVKTNQYRLMVQIARQNGFTEIRTIRDQEKTNKLDKRLFNAVTYRTVQNPDGTNVYYNKIPLINNPKLP